MLKWESVHKKRKTLILTILWMAFCTKHYYIKFRKQPQITVYRNVQHGNQRPKISDRNTHISHYIFPLSSYDNTGALYAIGFSLYDEIPPFQRQTARIFHVYCKGRKKERKERERTTDKISAKYVLAVHVQRILIDIQFVQKKEVEEMKKKWRNEKKKKKWGKWDWFLMVKKRREICTVVKRSHGDRLDREQDTEPILPSEFKMFSWIKVEDTENAPNQPWTGRSVCRDGRIRIDGRNIRSPAVATRKSNTAIMSGQHADVSV